MGSMTEQQKKQIAAYLPHPRDPELEDSEYYIMAAYSGRVHKVYISDIAEDRHFNTVYGVRYSATGKKFYQNDEYLCIRMGDLYDNKEDCRDQTHPCIDWWEDLRGLKE